MMLDPAQIIAALRKIETRTGALLAVQIRWCSTLIYQHQREAEAIIMGGSIKQAKAPGP